MGTYCESDSRERSPARHGTRRVGLSRGEWASGHHGQLPCLWVSENMKGRVYGRVFAGVSKEFQCSKIPLIGVAGELGGGRCVGIG